ncbi:MAG: zinc ABC transporter substrate-binding protein [Gloeomargaritaceae cyanobacterium C42_A2020_066]|nr:zinc ABC transporter substrate-binding protein [Gloeomargaritaceae cyanobacterium C42_A2020_066]
MASQTGKFGKHPSQIGWRWLGVLALGLGACGPAALTPNARPQVVAVGGVLCDLTRKVAKDTVDLTCLLEPGQDPHTYEPTSQDRKALETAQLVLYPGYDLIPTIDQLVRAAQTPTPKIAVFEQAVPKPLMGGGHDHDHEHGHEGEQTDSTGDADHDHDHEHDHDHADDKAKTTATAEHDPEAQVPDPHVWNDVRNGIAAVGVIETALTQLVPQEAERYQTQASALTATLTKLDGWVRQQIGTIPPAQRKLVTTHDALSYYAQAYNLPIEGVLQGVTTDGRPTPTRIAQLADQIRKAGVPAIFIESTANPDLINTVAKEAGVKVASDPLWVEGPGELGSGADTYIGMIATNTCVIVTNLGGTCQPFTAAQEAGTRP